MAIAQKECDESIYWIELLREAEYLKNAETQSIISDARELLKIINKYHLNHKTKNEFLIHHDFVA